MIFVYHKLLSKGVANHLEAAEATYFISKASKERFPKKRQQNPETM